LQNLLETAGQSAGPIAQLSLSDSAIKTIRSLNLFQIPFLTSIAAHRGGKAQDYQY